MNADQTWAFSRDERYSLCTATLPIADSGPSWSAPLDLLAAIAIRERVDELDIGVEFGRDLHLSDGEDTATTSRELRRCRKICCCPAFDDDYLLSVSSCEPIKS